MADSLVYETHKDNAAQQPERLEDQAAVEETAAAGPVADARQPAPPQALSRYWQRVQAGAQIGLFVLALLYTAHIAKGILQPLVVATLLYFLLHPIVRRAARAGMPVALASILIVGGMLGAAGTVGYQLWGPAIEWSEQAPRTLRRIGGELRVLKRPAQSVSQAAEEAEKIAAVEDEGRNREVRIEQPGLAESVWTTLRAFLLGTVLAIALLLFLLVYGERVIVRLLAFLLPQAHRDASEEIPLAVERRVSAYLRAFCLENAGLALVATLMFWLQGMPSPALWGILGGLLNFIPYLGAVTTSSVVGLVAYATFGTIWPALSVMGSYMALTAIEGVFIQPVVLGRRLSLNPLVMLIAVALGAWLWGIVGALVAVPSLVVLEAICDRVAVLKPFAALLS